MAIILYAKLHDACGVEYNVFMLINEFQETMKRQGVQEVCHVRVFDLHVMDLRKISQENYY